MAEYRFKLRRATSVQWAAKNPVLFPGEPGIELDTGKFKIGNGITAWNELPYFITVAQTSTLIQDAIDDVVLEGVPGDSAYQVAVENGFLGSEVEWLASLVGADGTNGDDGLSAYEIAVDNGFSGTELEWLASLVGPAGEDGVSGSGSDIYPLSAYGFISASVGLELAKNTSQLGNWVTRIWVPANEPITKIGTYVTSVGAAGSGNNSFAVYTDPGIFVDSTPSDNNLWTSAGWVLKALSTPIPAQETGRFVRVGVSIEGTSADILYATHDGPATLFNGGDIATHRRAWSGPSRSGGWPATIDVETEGNTYAYLPLFVLA